MTSAIKRYATRDFTDAGTGKSFAFAKVVNERPGILANYEAAGLVGDKPTTAPRSSSGGATA